MVTVAEVADGVVAAAGAAGVVDWTSLLRLARLALMVLAEPRDTAVLDSNVVDTLDVSAGAADETIVESVVSISPSSLPPSMSKTRRRYSCCLSFSKSSALTKELAGRTRNGLAGLAVGVIDMLCFLSITPSAILRLVGVEIVASFFCS